MKEYFLMRTWQTILLLVCFVPFAAYSELIGLDGRAEPIGLDRSAQTVFAAAKNSVVQVRTLLKGSQSQNSIGSGFYVSEDGLVITN